MSDSHRILVVDDDFATLDFLRSILELSEGDFEVLGVPSAEEGMLALRRANFNLLVADVRLPGMSGLEMARKAREVSPGIPVIMITGYDSPEAEAEAAALGVVNYFSKPLDAEDFLNAVFDAVEGIHALGIDSISGIDALPEGLVSVEVERRLEALRADTGAQQVVLAAVSGEILVCSGSLVDEDLQQLVTAMAFSMDSNFHLSDRLGADEPQTIQFLVGEKSDLYCANVNREHFLAILFDAQVRRGRIGTVWVFTRRAINDLRTMLVESPTQGEEDQSKLTEVVSPDPAAPTDRQAAEPTLSEMTEDIPSEFEKGQSENVDKVTLDSQTITSGRSVQDEEKEPDARNDSSGELEPDEQMPEGEIVLSNDQIVSPISEQSEPATDATDFKSTWDDVVQEETLDDSEGISFEEALKRGIISPDFNPEDE